MPVVSRGRLDRQGSSGDPSSGERAGALFSFLSLSLPFFLLSPRQRSFSRRYTRAVIYGTPTRGSPLARIKSVRELLIDSPGENALALRRGYCPRDVTTRARTQVVQETLFRDKCEAMKTIIYYVGSPAGRYLVHTHTHSAS